MELRNGISEEILRDQPDHFSFDDLQASIQQVLDRHEKPYAAAQ